MVFFDPMLILMCNVYHARSNIINRSRIRSPVSFRTTPIPISNSSNHSKVETLQSLVAEKFDCFPSGKIVVPVNAFPASCVSIARTKFRLFKTDDDLLMLYQVIASSSNSPIMKVFILFLNAVAVAEND